MKAILFVVGAMFSFNALAVDGYQTPSGKVYPWCTDKAIDPDNDGWGWENEASCKVPASQSKPVEDKDTKVWGIGELPVDEYGRRYYGDGPHQGNFTWKRSGRIRIHCHGDFFPDDDGFGDDDGCTAYVGKTSGGWVRYLKYSNTAGSCDCAKAKAIVACATENALAYCEENVAIGW